MADDPRPGRPDERSIESAEHERRRLERASETEYDRERSERHELDLVRQEIRRHDRNLKENGSS